MLFRHRDRQIRQDKRGPWKHTKGKKPTEAGIKQQSVDDAKFSSISITIITETKFYNWKKIIPEDEANREFGEFGIGETRGETKVSGKDVIDIYR